ncbi:MAG: TMEM175 family protein [Ancalomicrobiaceae bacterium]|nr:TMEM175 family protein [Ancalomicrobiaceae bacterium]
MRRTRLEAFSDGVFAILITIMVLELKVPHGAAFADLVEALPRFYTYVLSFIFVGIYWNNHHHLAHTIEHTTGGILWANLFLLFWISLFPFGCAWLDETSFAPWPTATYAFILFMAALSYNVLQKAIIHAHGPRSVLARAIGLPWKELISLALYVGAMGFAFVTPYIAHAFLVAVAVIWLVPDRRIERVVVAEEE